MAVHDVEALVVGAGPAGLMAADALSAAGRSVLVAEAKPSIGRKFLMAGKSGLNLTKNEEGDTFLSRYGAEAAWLRPMLDAFGPMAVMDWANGLGQPVFTGSTGRVFPVAMKASPLLRAWSARLFNAGVRAKTGWRFAGWTGRAATFETAGDIVRVTPRVTVLALGGASWARLGSDGAWAPCLAQSGVKLAPFRPSNAGIAVDWSAHMARHFGAPIKGTRLTAGGLTSRGEWVISRSGMEGGGVYVLTPAIRDRAPLSVDLLPDLDATQIATRLNKPRAKATRSNHMRKALRLDGARLALLQELGRPLPDTPMALATRIKDLGVCHNGPRPMDEAISTAGGVLRTSLTDDLMLRSMPGVFCAGEMLDWEAPTGGYLLTACLATGRWAGRAAARFLERAGG
ncbi:MAG: TIGR03862 family flavoprotein [Pseudomonadota bacterium]